LKTCKANTSARELSVWRIEYQDPHASVKEGRDCTFSPPDRFEMFFQLFLGGMTLKIIPSEKGSMLSTNSSSALPPKVIIYVS
jgi:hypothetical protein